MGKKIPEFTSEEEEARFWSTHDTVDYWEDMEEVSEGEIEIDPEFKARVVERAKERQLLSLGLEKRHISLAKRIARKKGVGYQTIIRSWIEEGIKQELAKKE
jgi:predicted DNA binding CopG/RHH family protein